MKVRCLPKRASIVRNWGEIWRFHKRDVGKQEKSGKSIEITGFFLYSFNYLIFIYFMVYFLLLNFSFLFLFLCQFIILNNFIFLFYPEITFFSLPVSQATKYGKVLKF